MISMRGEEHGMWGSTGRLVRQWLARLTHGCLHETHASIPKLYQVTQIKAPASTEILLDTDKLHQVTQPHLIFDY